MKRAGQSPRPYLGWAHRRAWGAALVGLLAGPVAAAPAVTAVKQGSEASGHLDSQGRWVWGVKVAPSAGGTALAIEIGFRENASPHLTSATMNTANWDYESAGTQIFGWEALTDVNPGPGVNMQPVGMQVNYATDEIFAAMGSVPFETGGAKDFITIVVEGPKLGALTTSLQWLGIYGSDGHQGRIAEFLGSMPTTYDIYSGSAGRTALAGDVDLNGVVNSLDLTTLTTVYGQTTAVFWQHGNFDGDKDVDAMDFLTWQRQFGATAAIGQAASADAAPEPGTINLAAVLAAWVGATRRRWGRESWREPRA